MAPRLKFESHPYPSIRWKSGSRIAAQSGRNKILGSMSTVRRFRRQTTVDLLLVLAAMGAVYCTPITPRTDPTSIHSEQPPITCITRTRNTFARDKSPIDNWSEGTFVNTTTSLIFMKLNKGSCTYTKRWSDFSIHMQNTSLQPKICDFFP